MTKSISLINLVAFLIVLLPASCEKDADIDLSKEYFPLQVGNYWEFSPEPWTDSIDKIVTIDSANYYRMLTRSWRTNLYRDTSYYRKTEDGKIYLRFKLTTGDILKFDLEAQVGQTWDYWYNWSWQEYPWIASLKSKNDIILLGDDSIKNCYRYYYDIPQMADEEDCRWLAPGIGPVMINNNQTTTGGYKLKRARINGSERQF